MMRVLGILSVLLLVSCATASTIYGPSGDGLSAGYREQKIENDRYRVTFLANSDLEPDEVEALALRRAAEITEANGQRWFTVVARRTDLAGGQEKPGRASVGIGGSVGPFGSRVGTGVGLIVAGADSRYESTIEIVIARGEKPASPGTYEAQDILADLE